MPIPFILAGIALAAGGYGVKKGFDAKKDFDHAKELNTEAKDIYDSAAQRLEYARDQTQEEMNELGQFKFEMYEERLIPFVNTFSKIKNVDFRDQQLQDEFNLNDLTQEDMRAIQKAALEMQEVVGAGITALGAGGLAGLAVYGGVGWLATASTGTAIASLSGAAATNATLAWLGGGRLAAGGFGMAGGTAILGGIVAGPVLAIGGMMLASKAEEAKNNAYSNRDNARSAAEQMKTATIVTRAIGRRFNQIHSVLIQLDAVFQPLLLGLQKLVSKNTNYATYSSDDRKGVMMAAMMAKTLKNILEVPILDESGSLTTVSEQALLEAQQKTLEFSSR
jgi:hypothetical protein